MREIRCLMTGVLLCGIWLTAGCDDEPAAGGAGGAPPWMEGTAEQNVEQLARHYGGMSTAMMEIGYRYNELYFAGADENWPLAGYHAGKIRDAMEHGIERRPGRDGPGAQQFLNEAMPRVAEAIEQQDAGLFQERFEQFVQSCNACHVEQQMGFLEITVPEERIIPWTTPWAE